MMIDKLKAKIKPVAEKYNIELIVLYGSRARGDHRADRDYDFLIQFNRSGSLIQLAQFIIEIEKTINGKVDVTTVPINEMDDYLKSEIVKDGIEIFNIETSVAASDPQKG